MIELNNFDRATQGVDSAQRANPLPDTAVLSYKDSESYHIIRLDAMQLEMVSIMLEFSVIACYDSNLVNVAIYLNEILKNDFRKGGVI